jgi:hypothetical protein
MRVHSIVFLRYCCERMFTAGTHPTSESLFGGSGLVIAQFLPTANQQISFGQKGCIPQQPQVDETMVAITRFSRRPASCQISEAQARRFDTWEQPPIRLRLSVFSGSPW